MSIVQQKIIKKIIEVARGLLVEKEKFTLEAQRDFHAHATDNNGSIKKESKVIKMVFIQIPFITPHQILIQKVTPNFPI